MECFGVESKEVSRFRAYRVWDFYWMKGAAWHVRHQVPPPLEEAC